MEDSEIQTICRSIYKKHKRALDLIFEYKLDRQMEIYECLLEIIKADKENLILDYSTKSIIRFTSKNLDFVPAKGHQLESKKMLVFELINNTKSLILYLIIYAGPKEIRDKIHSLAQRNKVLFNMVRDKYADQYTGIYKKQILRSGEHEEKDIEWIKELLKERIQDFQKNDLPKIVNVMKQFEISQNDQKE